LSDQPTIKIHNDVVEEMKEHARETRPLEACGLLLGDNHRIDEYYEMTNTDESEVHFTFDPQEQVQEQKYARDNGKDVLGVFHSHPDHDSRAYPSEEDREMGYSGYLYFILNFQPGETIINAFTIEDDRISERNYELIGS